MNASTRSIGLRCSNPCRVAVVAGLLFATWVATRATVAAQQPSRSVWDGVYSTEQANRGSALYTRRCASCHGPELGGADVAPPLAGGAFLSNWDGTTLGDLSERIRTSMPIDDPGTLSRQQVSDVLAFVLGASSFPAGTSDLPREAELLKQIRFEATKH